MENGAGDDRDFQAVDVRRAAMDLLARREYGRRELAGRLAGRGMPGELIEQILDDLARENLQSDARFAEAFVSARIGRGQGPVRIRVELEHKGIDSGLVDEALEASDTDWGTLAGEVRRKRFGSSAPEDFKARARQARFLQYRGFASEHVRRALGDED